MDFGDPTERLDAAIRSEPTHLDRTRSRLAFALVILLAGALATAWVAVLVHPSDAANIKDLTSITVPPIVGLVGAAIGFYFGSGARRH